MPLILSIAYSILRQIFDNEECWIKPTFWWIEWTIIIPCVLCLSVSLRFMFICNRHYYILEWVFL